MNNDVSSLARVADENLPYRTVHYPDPYIYNNNEFWLLYSDLVVPHDGHDGLLKTAG